MKLFINQQKGKYVLVTLCSEFHKICLHCVERPQETTAVVLHMVAATQMPLPSLEKGNLRYLNFLPFYLKASYHVDQDNCVK